MHTALDVLHVGRGCLETFGIYWNVGRTNKIALIMQLFSLILRNFISVDCCMCEEPNPRAYPSVLKLDPANFEHILLQQSK